MSSNANGVRGRSGVEALPVNYTLLKKDLPLSVYIHIDFTVSSGHSVAILEQVLERMERAQHLCRYDWR